jgi:predicted PurR-regulated permease PerM
MGVLFGPMGVVLAAPLVVTLVVLVQQLYVRDTLGYEITISGQKDRP